MTNTTEYNFEVETSAATVFVFTVSLTGEEMKAFETLVGEKAGSVEIGISNHVFVELDATTTHDVLNNWGGDITDCNYYYCSDRGFVLDVEQYWAA